MIRYRSIIFVILIIAAIAASFSWHVHENRIERRNKKIAEAEQEKADLSVTKMQVTWNADKHWENSLQGDASVIPYTTDLERVLIKNRPTIFFGYVEDVSSSENGNYIVFIRPDTKEIPLRLALVTSTQVAAVIENSHCRFFCNYIFVASVTSIEKLSSSKKSDDDYFLLHGVMEDVVPEDLKPSGF